MTRPEPIRDFHGDLIAVREQADRALERGDSPTIHLDIRPQQPCSECGYMAREVRPGHWACPCESWSQVA